MGNTALAKTPGTAMHQAIERALVEGDLSGLSSADRITFYRQTCESLGLNPLTKPFSYLKLNGKLVLYALRDATDQLRKLHNISITIVSREKIGNAYVVTARATTPDGRSDESTGAVPISEKLDGEALSSALMKAETKAKRRVTLSIVGLGILDESEVGSIKHAREVKVDAATGEILEQGTPAPAPVALVAAPPALEEAGDDATMKRLMSAMRSSLDAETRETAEVVLAKATSDATVARQQKKITPTQRRAIFHCYEEVTAALVKKFGNPRADDDGR